MSLFLGRGRWSQSTDQDDRKWASRIVLFAIALRVIAAVFWQQHCDSTNRDFAFDESQMYWDIASNLVRGSYGYGGEEFSIRIPCGPVYPCSLVPFTLFSRCSNSSYSEPVAILAARFMGCILGGLAVWLLMHWVRIVSGTLAARFSGIIASLYGGAVGMSIFILNEAIATPLFLVSYWLLWRTCQVLYNPSEHDTSRTRLAVLVFASSTFFALACLASPAWGLWCFLAFPFIVFAKRTSTGFSLRKFLVHAVVFLAWFCVVMSPWWIRNYAITGRFVPATLTVGASLYDGLHQGADGGVDEYQMSQSESSSRVITNVAMRVQPAVNSTLEFQIDQRLRHEALQWATSNPAEAVRLGVFKFLRTWSHLPSNRKLANLFVLVWEGASYLIVLFLSSVGLLGAIRNRQLAMDRLWFVMPCIYLGLIHLVLPGGVRYRLPAVLILCGLAGIGMVELLSRSSFAKICSMPR